MNSLRLSQLQDGTAPLEGVLDAGLFRTQAEMLGLHRVIATIDASAPLPSLADQAPTCASSSSLVRSRGLNQ